MRRRLAGVLGLVVLVAGGCSSGGSSTKTSDTTAGGTKTGAQTLPIGIDAQAGDFATSWTHFFPHDLQAHPGDTLQFTSHFTGEPHTVAFGTLITEYLAASAKVDPGTLPTPEVQAVLNKIPNLLNGTGKPDGYFLQAASQPCYLVAEEPSTKDACPKEKQLAPKEITGKERFLNTGFLADEKGATFKLAADMAPGQYTFMCLVHGPQMTEMVTVVDKATAIPGPAEVAKMGREHLNGFVSAVQPLVEPIQTSTSPQAQAGTHLDDEAVPNAGIHVLPKEIDVKAGEKVTWTFDGFHSLAFNAPEDARPWMQFDGSGALVVNPKSFTPAASPVIPEPAPHPPGTAIPQVKVDAGTWDGQGFHSSGAAFSGAPLVYSLAFSSPGTYKYLCLIHPDMEGAVKVT